MNEEKLSLEYQDTSRSKINYSTKLNNDSFERDFHFLNLVNVTKLMFEMMANNLQPFYNLSVVMRFFFSFSKQNVVRNVNQYLKRE